MNWEKLCINPDATIRETLTVLDINGMQFVMVVDEKTKLLGVVTDGNIRRGMLAGYTLETPVVQVMHSTPCTVGVGVSAQNALHIMEANNFTHLPVLDAQGRVVSVWSFKDLLNKPTLSNSVVLMVGGLGSRLGELTRHVPKPMLPMGGQPMLEIVLRNCMEWGLRHFYMAVNYKAHMVSDYFGDGSRFGCSIEYIRETKRMGTAGALSLLPRRPGETFFVTNGDVLTHINMHRLLEIHRASQAPATMVVRKHSMRLPYGVVERDAAGMFKGIHEKPLQEFCVNAGIYALEPEALDFIPEDTFFDMPELFASLLRAGRTPYTHETQEYWIDVGQVAEYKRAQGDFSENC